MSSPVMLSADLIRKQGLDFTTGVPYPLFASIKYDGIRAYTSPQGLLSRERKRIRNHYIQGMLSSLDSNIDGELIAVDSHGNDLTYRETQSAVNSYEGESLFRFRVFDYFTVETDPYEQRLQMLNLAVAIHGSVEIVRQTLIRTPTELHAYLQEQLRHGREGAMVRTLNGRYKFGRSTLNEFYLVKLKVRETDVATIVGSKEEMENTNEATISDNGFVKRSKHAEGMVPKNTLGALIVTHAQFGEFEIGGGSYLTALRRKILWENRHHLPGLQVRFTYDNAKTSGYDKPRTPQLVELLGDIPSPLKVSLA